MDNYNFRMKDIIDRYYSLINTNKNIVGVGIGSKNINGKSLNVPCLTFYVKNKLSEDKLDRRSIIPQRFYGILTDVLDIGKGKGSEYATPLADDKIIKPAGGGELIANASPNSRIGTLSIALTDITDSGIADVKNNTYLLSTARVLTGNFKALSAGETIVQKSGVTLPIIEEKIGLLTKWSTVDFTNSNNDKSITKWNELDTGIAFVEKLTDPFTNQPKQPKDLRVAPGLWNGLDIKVDPRHSDIIAGTQVYVVTKKGGMATGKIETKSFSGYYQVGDKDAYFRNQFTVDINIQLWDYGALLLKVVDSGGADGKKEVYAIGQIIAHVGDTKSRKVMVTPIEKVLKFTGKQIYKTK